MAQIDQLLESLTSQPRPDDAWKRFLDLYSPAILRVVGKYEHDDARKNDCFVYVCGKLSDNSFRRLLAYRTGSDARFVTWLSTVVANLCVDWRRNQYGRFRPLKSVRALPRLEQTVFRYLFELGMTRHECLHTLEPQFPGITEQHVSKINARLFSLFNSRQRWKLSMRSPVQSVLDTGAVEPAADPAANPVRLAQLEQDRDRVQTALATLPARQCLLLRLRYQQDLSLKDIARVTQLADTNRAHREIESALAMLGKLLAP